MTETLKFICRRRKRKNVADVTWINANRMPYYNPAMISLYACSESVLNPGFRSRLHPMVYWALEYICEGEYLVLRDDRQYRLRPGDILILHPGVRYGQANPGDSPVRKKEIMLNNSPLISILCNRSDLNGREVFRCTDPPAVETFFDRIRDAVSSPVTDGRLECNLTNLIFALFTEVIAQCGSSGIYNSFDILLKQLDIFSPGLSLDSMAEHFKVGKRTLNRIFNRQLNCSPIQYLISERMKYAAQLLSSNTLSVKNVAEECGYRYPGVFISEFRKFFGKTPLEYRRGMGIFDDSELKKLIVWGRKKRKNVD